MLLLGLFESPDVSYISALVFIQYWLVLYYCRWLSPEGDKRVMMVVNLLVSTELMKNRANVFLSLIIYKAPEDSNWSGLGHGCNTYLAIVARRVGNCGSLP